MLYNQLSSVLVCSFWVDEGKDRQTLENVEQKSSNPYRQLALSGSVFLWKKWEKVSKRKHQNNNPFSPHHPQNHLWRDGHFGDGTKACTDVLQAGAQQIDFVIYD